MPLFKTTLLTQKTEVLALASEWNPLLNRSTSQNIFLTWEWISSWLQHLHSTEKIWVISVRDVCTNKLMAIAPLMIQVRKINTFISLNELCFLASNAGPDHLDFILDAQYIAELSTELKEFIAAQKKAWDLIHLEGSRNHALAHLIFNATETHCDSYPVVCPYLNLPSSWNEYLKTLGRKRRYNIGAYKRKLAKAFPQQVEYQKIQTSEELNHCMPELFNLHQQAQQAQGRNGIFADLAQQDFHRTLCHNFLKNKWLRLYFLRVNGHAISVYYCFNYQNRVSFYTTGFALEWAARSPGQQLLYYVLEQSINEHAHIFDFLRGDEDYKLIMTKTVDEDQRFIAPHTLIGRSACWLFAQKKKLNKVM